MISLPRAQNVRAAKPSLRTQCFQITNYQYATAFAI